jgi:hypothetical protein
MKKTLYILLSIVVFASCNEYSITEGIKPKGSITKLLAGTKQSKVFPTNGIRFSPYVETDLGLGKITITTTNSFNADKKVTVIEKYYTDLTTCGDFIESTVDFDFTNEVNSNRNYYLNPNTTCIITYSTVTEDGSTLSGTMSTKIGSCYKKQLKN